MELNAEAFVDVNDSLKRATPLERGVRRQLGVWLPRFCAQSKTGW
jgi:hypothetical protein